MVNEHVFENHKAEIEIPIGNKIVEVINKLKEAIIAKLEANKDEIIQIIPESCQ